MGLKENTSQRRLATIILAIGAAVLLLACTTILIFEFLTFRQTGVQQASTLACLAAAIYSRSKILETVKAVSNATFCGFITDRTERKHAESKLQTQLSRMELLERITRATAERQDLPSIFQVVIASLERNLPIDFGCMCLYVPGEKVLTVLCVGTKSEPHAVQLAMTPQDRK